MKSYITRFQQRVKEPTEGPEYISALRDLASHCEFGELEDRQVVIQISNFKFVRSGSAGSRCQRAWTVPWP